MEENIALSCEHCDLHATKLLAVGTKKVCRLCKEDHKENGKFTRAKVKHDYVGSEALIAKFHKDVEDKQKGYHENAAVKG